MPQEDHAKLCTRSRSESDDAFMARSPSTPISGNWCPQTIVDREFRVPHGKKEIRARLRRDAALIRRTHATHPESTLPDLARMVHQDLSYVHKVLAAGDVPAKAVLIQQAWQDHPEWTPAQIATYVGCTQEEVHAARMRIMRTVPQGLDNSFLKERVLTMAQAHPSWGAKKLAWHLRLPVPGVQAILREQCHTQLAAQGNDDRTAERSRATKAISPEDRRALERSARLLNWSQEMLEEAMVNLQHPWVPQAHKNALRYARADPLVYDERGHVIRPLRNSRPSHQRAEDDIDHIRTQLWAMYAHLEAYGASQVAAHLWPPDLPLWHQHLAQTQQHLVFIQDVLRYLNLHPVDEGTTVATRLEPMEG